MTEDDIRFGNPRSCVSCAVANAARRRFTELLAVIATPRLLDLVFDDRHVASMPSAALGAPVPGPAEADRPGVGFRSHRPTRRPEPFSKGSSSSGARDRTSGCLDHEVLEGMR